ncbi:MAG: DUF7118 family protein [Halodesulfurarchaeum sp.]
MTSTEANSAAALVETLRAARREREAAREAVAEIGEETLDELESNYGEFRTLLDRYEDRASGSGDFQAFVRFQEELEQFTEGLPSDLPERETFEAIDDRLQKRRLTESDFDWARARLEPVEDLLDRLERRSRAERQVAQAEGDVRAAIRETEAEIDRLETVRSLADADLDAPVDRLRDPIEAYNDRVREAVYDFRRSAPAREVIGVLDQARHFPLVPVRSPPPDLKEYLASEPVGEEPIPTLLEYADYSRSKLDHYVESPATFSRVVGGNRTYLDGIDAAAFTIEWPPPAPRRLRYRGRELVAMLSRFAPESTVEGLRTVLDRARGDPAQYERLRHAARAREELTAAERERVADGSLAADLDAARDRLETLRAALEGDQYEAS